MFIVKLVEIRKDIILAVQNVHKWPNQALL